MECLAEASVMAVDQGKEQVDDLVQPDSESYKSLLDEYTHLAPAEGEVLQGTVLKVNAKVLSDDAALLQRHQIEQALARIERRGHPVGGAIHGWAGARAGRRRLTRRC